MQIAVLSDLHLGAKDPLDRFHRAREAEARLLEALSRLERAVDRVVLLGDVFETLRGPVPGPSERDLRAAMEAYPELTERALHHPRYSLVHGNHDIIAGPTMGVPEFLELEDHGVRMLFFHGHQMDTLARGRAPFSRLGIWLGGLLERLGLPVTHRVDAIRGRDWTEDGDVDPTRLERAALALGRARHADVVVNGHTHNAVRHEIDHQVYLNSGTWLCGRREWVLIDTSRKSFDIVVE